MPESERNRFLYGLFSESSDGQAYYAFDRDRHVDAKATKMMGTIYIGMDFNVHPMTAIICQVINNVLIVFDEVYLENSDTYKMRDHLVRHGYAGSTIIPDSTGANRKTSGATDFQILKEVGFTIPTVRNPLQVDRVNNINRLLTEDRIKINPKCKKLITDLEKVNWKDGKLDQTGENKMLTHISDCLGYACWKLLPLEATVRPITINKYR
jgi:phage terminase large subunit